MHVLEGKQQSVPSCTAYIILLPQTKYQRERDRQTDRQTDKWMDKQRNRVRRGDGRWAELHYRTNTTNLKISMHQTKGGLRTWWICNACRWRWMHNLIANWSRDLGVGWLRSIVWIAQNMNIRMKNGWRVLLVLLISRVEWKHSEALNHTNSRVLNQGAFVYKFLKLIFCIVYRFSFLRIPSRSLEYMHIFNPHNYVNSNDWGAILKKKKICKQCRNRTSE